MYVDESGDTGRQGSPTRFFALSGLVIHESRWRQFLQTLIAFRKTLRAVHGLPIRAEIHASEFIKKHKDSVYGLERYVRLAILRNTLDELASIPDIMITNVIVDKQGKPANYDVFESAWRTLFQRFENTLMRGNFPGAHRQDHGLVITDATSGKKLSRLVRRMAVFNYIPNMGMFGGGSRNLPIVRVIEDPYGKDSAQTLPVQMVDVTAYFLMQKFAPNGFIKKQKAQNYFERLSPVLNTWASYNDKFGIVRL